MQHTFKKALIAVAVTSSFASLPQVSLARHD